MEVLAEGSVVDELFIVVDGLVHGEDTVPATERRKGTCTLHICLFLKQYQQEFANCASSDCLLPHKHMHTIYNIQYTVCVLNNSNKHA
jgi:hypothetical protein